MTALALARFALYADVCVVFGVPAAAMLLRTRVDPVGLRPLVIIAALLGLPLTLVAFMLTVAEMAGTGLHDLDWQLVGDLVTGTALGWAFLARISALSIAAALGLMAPRRPAGLAAAGAIAIASLAWSGHAAAGEGALGSLQLAADIVHLLAAATWLGG